MKLGNSSSLIVSFDTSASLNFMVFLQNAMLTEAQGRPKFPRVKSEWMGFVDDQNIHDRFELAWKESISLLQAHGKDTFPYEGYDTVYREFFVSEEAYHDFYLTFNSWWVGGGGRSLVSSVHHTSEIYEYAVNLAGVVGQNLQVQFVYDDVLLTSHVVSKGFVVLSIPEVEILHHTGKTTLGIEAKVQKALS